MRPCPEAHQEPTANGVPSRHTTGSDPGTPDIPGKPQRALGSRCQYVSWMVLAAYLLLLLHRALSHSKGGALTNAPVWELQGARQLLGWIGRVVLGGLYDLACFVPVGFLATRIVPCGSGWLGRLPMGIRALGMATVLAVLVRAVEGDRLWQLAAAVHLVLPLLGCLLGTWIGTTWLRGRHARLWLLPKVASLALLAVFLVGGLVWLSLEQAPLPFEATHATSAEKQRLSNLTRSQSPRLLQEGQTQTLRLTQRDVNVLLSARFSLESPQRKARVSLAGDSASLALSIGVPLGRGRSRYLNCEVTDVAGVDEGVLNSSLSRCRLGSLEVPSWLLWSLSPVVTSLLNHSRGSRPFLAAIQRMKIEADSIEVTYGRLQLPSGPQDAPSGTQETQDGALTITATAGAGGSVHPGGSLSVAKGTDVTFTMTPRDGYVVANINIDGVSQGAAPSYTLYGAQTNSRITASFLPKANAIAETIYVDNRLTSDCLHGEYSLANRDHSGKDGNAYITIVEAANVAGPGDTVLIRGGTYHACRGAKENDVLWPKHSGTPQNPIRFKPYEGEEVVLGDAEKDYPNDDWASVARTVITMRNVSHIEIEGLKIRHVAGWLFARDCHHITVRNCRFEDSLWSSKGTARFVECANCKILSNTFSRSSFDSLALIKSDHNLIENNTFVTAGHCLLALRSASFNVIRSNHFSNPYYKDGDAHHLTEVYDQKVDTWDTRNPLYIPVPGYNGTRHNVFEKNVFGYHPDKMNVGSRTSAIQFSGQETMIRHNVFFNPPRKTPDPDYPEGVAGGVALYMRWGGSWDGWNKNAQRIVGEGQEAGFVTHNRIYGNVFHGYDGGKVTLPEGAMNNLPNPPPTRNVANYLDYPFTEKYAFEDNIFKNNVFSSGVIVPHVNLTWLVRLKGKPVQLLLMGRLESTYFENNDFFAAGPNSDQLIYDAVHFMYADPKPPAYFNASYQTFSGNLQQDPRFLDADHGDFRLQAGSPLIDAGAFLTSLRSPAGSGSQITVADAMYFYDGYGIEGEQGDLIRLQNGQVARVVRIDFSANRMTLDRQISWSNDEKVSLDYRGTAPDIGAYEYTPDPVAAPAVSGTAAGARQ